MKLLLLSFLLLVTTLAAQNPWLNDPFSGRMPKSHVEFVPLGHGEWYDLIDPAYEKAGSVYPLFSPFLGYLTKVMVLPTQARGEWCFVELRFGVVQGAEPYSYWILVNPSVPEGERSATLEQAFAMVFRIVSGRDRTGGFTLPDCLQKGEKMELKRNSGGQIVFFPAIDTAGNEVQPGESAATTWTIKVVKDGGLEQPATGTCSIVGTGVVRFLPSASDTDGLFLSFRFTGTRSWSNIAPIYRDFRTTTKDIAVFTGSMVSPATYNPTTNRTSVTVSVAGATADNHLRDNAVQGMQANIAFGNQPIIQSSAPSDSGLGALNGTVVSANIHPNNITQILLEIQGRPLGETVEPITGGTPVQVIP